MSLINIIVIIVPFTLLKVILARVIVGSVNLLDYLSSPSLIQPYIIFYMFYSFYLNGNFFFIYGNFSYQY